MRNNNFYTDIITLLCEPSQDFLFNQLEAIVSEEVCKIDFIIPLISVCSNLDKE